MRSFLAASAAEFQLCRSVLLNFAPYDYTVGSDTEFNRVRLRKREDVLPVGIVYFSGIVRPFVVHPRNGLTTTGTEQSAGQYGNDRRELHQPIHASPSGGHCRLSAFRWRYACLRGPDAQRHDSPGLEPK
jgi:hypothetical protein